MRLLHEESDVEWRTWLEEQGLSLDTATLPGPRMWHAHVALEAARNGEGIALANSLLVGTLLAAGHLVPLTASEQPLQNVTLGDYCFTAREDRRRDPALRLFYNWLEARAAEAGRAAATF